MEAVIGFKLLPIPLLLLLTLLPSRAHALNVVHQAAIGIGISFGALIVITVAGLFFIKYYKRKERRAALERGDVELTEDPEAVAKPTKEEVLEAHGRNMKRQNFDIWGK